MMRNSLEVILRRGGEGAHKLSFIKPGVSGFRRKSVVTSKLIKFSFRRIKIIAPCGIYGFVTPTSPDPRRIKEAGLLLKFNAASISSSFSFVENQVGSLLLLEASAL